MLQELLTWVFIAIACVLLVLPVFGMPRANVPRKVDTEGFDDPAFGAGFAALQETPTFKKMRQVFVHHIFNTSFPIDKSRVRDILDIGCGTGHLIKAIHDELGRRGMNAAIHGIDIGASSMAQCREYFARSSIGDIDLKKGDAALLPFPDASMDIVVSSLSLHHWSKPEKVFSEIHRVLRSGGQLVLFDLRRDTRKFFHIAFSHWFQPRMPEPLKSAGEPYASMLAAYTVAEASALIGNTPWKSEQMKIIPSGFRIVVDAVKK